MAERPEPEPRDGATVATLCAAVLGAIFTVLALATFGSRAALSVAVGATIAVANLLMLRAIIRSILKPPDEATDAGDADEADPPPTYEDSREDGRRGGTAWGIFAVLKIFVLFAGVWFLLTKKVVDPIPLVVGYGVLPLGITASALVETLFPSRHRRAGRRPPDRRR